ncbi:MAG: hypothetical protein Q7J44_20935 [Pseudotabrizicola sp.]|uniref:hypothetical protein n=1 Tax=Pseudotabrizicola sp. TaxID=2939647 RepID=UPI0027164739|nr:hypothetical protein [Pseudotabrizicola sp.]MDO9641005.1 hypothetical protein [Pseudotabrizicola sp.]
MTNTPHIPLRATLTGATPKDALSLLPQMGKVMLVVSASGVTHERIGPVETVTEGRGRLLISGACHEASIDGAAVAGIVLDTRSVMRDKVYPRLEFLDATGQAAFSLVGMDGLEAFTDPLSCFRREILPPRDTEVMPGAGRNDLQESDPVHLPFQTLLLRGGAAAITFDTGTLRQTWRGVIEATKPAMGFLNVMTGDFHLHLKGGRFRAGATPQASASRWTEAARRTGL